MDHDHHLASRSPPDQKKVAAFAAPIIAKYEIRPWKQLIEVPVDPIENRAVCPPLRCRTTVAPLFGAAISETGMIDNEITETKGIRIEVDSKL